MEITSTHPSPTGGTQMAVRVHPDEMKKIVTPKFQIGQFEWPTGWLVKVEVYDEEVGYGTKRCVLAETGQREAKAAMPQLRSYVETALWDSLDGRERNDHRLDVTPHDDKHGLTIALVWQPDGPEFATEVEAQVDVWYEPY
jgi:hypothetical protein